MAATNADEAVRNYLVAAKDPSALRDETRVQQLRKRLEETRDQLERLRLRQQLAEAEKPDVERFEEEFVARAKEWAEANQVSPRAFLEEGVPPAVLRRAGFSVSARNGRTRRSMNGRRRPRSRVTSDEVRAAIPRSQFTIKQLQERSGASVAVVRKVIQEEEAAGRLSRVGTDTSHSGPGRAPTLYKRSR